MRWSFSIQISSRFPASLPSTRGTKSEEPSPAGLLQITPQDALWPWCLRGTADNGQAECKLNCFLASLCENTLALFLLLFSYQPLSCWGGQGHNAFLVITSCHWKLTQIRAALSTPSCYLPSPRVTAPPACFQPPRSFCSSWLSHICECSSPASPRDRFSVHPFRIC